MESEDISLENSCRLCLKIINGEILSVSIFETVVICPSIPVKIKTCVSIDVQAEDPLPKYICRDCHNKLDDFLAFKQVCLDADSRLKTLLECNTTYNSTTSDKDSLDDSYDDTIQDYKPCLDSTTQMMPSQITVSPLDMGMFIKTEPYYSEEEECGLADAMELDALSDDAEIDVLNVEPSTATEHLSLPIQICNTFSLTSDNQRLNETVVKVEPPEDDANTMETTHRDKVFRPIQMEIITEEEPLDENIPLAHYMRRKIICVRDGHFVYSVNDEAISDKLRRRYWGRTESRSYVCCVCPAAFKDGWSVRQHEKRAHPIGPYRCGRCLATRRRLPGLRRHVANSHRPCDGPPPPLVAPGPPRLKDNGVSQPAAFSCQPCNLGFQHKGALICHQAFYHRHETNRNLKQQQRQVFTCNVCGTIFESREHYLLHREAHNYEGLSHFLALNYTA